MITKKEIIANFSRTLLENWVNRTGNQSWLSANIASRLGQTLAFTDSPLGMFGRIRGDHLTATQPSTTTENGNTQAPSLELSGKESNLSPEQRLEKKDTFFKKISQDSQEKRSQLGTYRHMRQLYREDGTVSEKILFDSLYPDLASFGYCGEKTRILAIEAAKLSREAQEKSIDIFLIEGKNFDHTCLLLAPEGSYDKVAIERQYFSLAIFDKTLSYIADPWLMSYFSLDKAPLYWQDSLIADSTAPNNVIQAYGQKDMDWEQPNHPFWANLLFRAFPINERLLKKYETHKIAVLEKVERMEEEIEMWKARQTELDDESVLNKPKP